MTRIYITEPGARLTTRQGRLIMLVDGFQKNTWPLEQVDAVRCFGPVHISGHGLAQLFDAQIRVEWFSSRGRFRGAACQGYSLQPFVRMAHQARWQDAAYRLEMARATVQHKLEGQLALLRSCLNGLEAQSQQDVGQTVLGLEQVLRRLESAPDLETVMGHEGYGSKLYFGVFGRLLRPGIPFQGRSRRPPLDAPNALLSLGYTLVGQELEGLLEAEGLEPMLAFLHGFRYGRGSLSLDLVEAFRPSLVDRWVLTLFNQRQVGLELFEQRDGGVYLTKAGFKAVLNRYQTVMGDIRDGRTWRGQLRRRVEALKDAVLDGRVISRPDWLPGGGDDALSAEL